MDPHVESPQNAATPSTTTASFSAPPAQTLKAPSDDVLRQSTRTSTLGVDQGAALDEAPVILAEPKGAMTSASKRRISRRRLAGIGLLGFGVLATVLLGIRVELNKSNALNTSRITPSSELLQQQASISSLNKQLGTTAPANGMVTINGSLVLTPTVQPANPIPGQLYYDQALNQMQYYNGTSFVHLQGGNDSTGSNTNITNNISSGTSLQGTAGTLTRYGTDGNSLADSVISQSGSTVSVAGVLTLPKAADLQIGRSQVTSTDLADTANLARLNAAQTFTGANTFQNRTDSTTALQVLNASGANILGVDTTNNQLVLGADGATPTATTIRAGNAVGSNTVGANLNVMASDGTGVGGSGSVDFYTGGGIADPLVTFDNTSEDQGPDTTSAAGLWPLTVGAESSRVLLVTVDTTFISGPGAVATAVTYDGLALTEIAGPSGIEANGSVWYLASPPSGTHNVHVSYSGPSSSYSSEATSFYNVDPSNPIAGYTSQSEYATNISGTLTGTNAGQGVFDAVMARGDWGLPTPGPGQAQLYYQGTYGRSTASFRQQGQAGSTTMSWTGQGDSSLNQVIVALTPEPNLTPDPLSQTLSITQSNTLGIDLGSTENALSTISFGGNADRSIGINQNPTTGAGHNLTLQAGTGAVGSNNGGNLILQGGGATGSGVGGSVIVKPQTDSAATFQIQAASGTSLFVADTSDMTISIAGTATTFATLAINNAHFESTQTTAPTISTPLNCGTGATATITAGSSDAAGSLTVHTGTGSPTTCDTTLTFNQAYETLPKSIVLTPTTAFASTAAPIAQVASPSTTAFTAEIAPTDAAADMTYSYYYWVVE